jgi:uncharacterized protein (TIGR03083 family)
MSVSRTEAIQNLRTTWAALDGVAGSLTPEQWIARSLCPDWDMRGVMVHAATIEQAILGWPPGGEPPFAKFRGIHEELSALAPDELLARFRSIISQRLADLDSMTDEDFATPGMTPIGPGTYGRFMEIRSFDNWVHERDMRVPLGLPGDDGGPAAERALDEVHNSLGYIVGKKIGLTEGQSIAFDITGPVARKMYAKVEGRAAVVPSLDDPDATVSSDFLTFMLLACGRIDPSEAIADGRITWSGDAEVGERAARNLRFTI